MPTTLVSSFRPGIAMSVIALPALTSIVVSLRYGSTRKISADLISALREACTRAAASLGPIRITLDIIGRAILPHLRPTFIRLPSVFSLSHGITRLTHAADSRLEIIITAVANSEPVQLDSTDQWNEVLGYIERNGKDFGVSNEILEERLTELQGEQDEKIDELNTKHHEEIVALSNKHDREKRKLAVELGILFKARKGAQNKFITQERRLQERSEALTSKERVIAEKGTEVTDLKRQISILAAELDHFKKDKAVADDSFELSQLAAHSLREQLVTSNSRVIILLESMKTSEEQKAALKRHFKAILDENVRLTSNLDAVNTRAASYEQAYLQSVRKNEELEHKLKQANNAWINLHASCQASDRLVARHLCGQEVAENVAILLVDQLDEANKQIVELEHDLNRAIQKDSSIELGQLQEANDRIASLEANNKNLTHQKDFLFSLLKISNGRMNGYRNSFENVTQQKETTVDKIMTTNDDGKYPARQLIAANAHTSEPCNQLGITKDAIAVAKREAETSQKSAVSHAWRHRETSDEHTFFHNLVHHVQSEQSAEC